MKKIIVAIIIAIVFIANAYALMEVEVQILTEEKKVFVLNGDYYEVEFNTEYNIDDKDFLCITGTASFAYKKDNTDVFIISGLSKGNYFEYRVNTNEICDSYSEFNSHNFLYFDDAMVMTRSSYVRFVVQGQKYEKVKFKIHKDYFTPYQKVCSQELLNVTNTNDLKAVFAILNYTDPDYYDKKAPVFELNKKVYTDISNPIQLDSIIKGVKAIDEYCGDLSDRIKIEMENYNPNQVGEYLIRISVTDDFNNSAYEEIEVYVVDFYAPTIIGPNYYEVGIVKYITIDEIVGALEIKDNSNIQPTIRITDGYTPNKAIVGEYSVIVHAIDSVYNESAYEVIIKVKDDLAPIVNGEDIKAYMSENKTVDDLKQFTYSDNYTEYDKLKVSYDTDYNPLKKGEYYISCSVIDELDNETILSIKVLLIDDIKPEFVENNKIVSSYLTKDEMYKYFNKA